MDEYLIKGNRIYTSDGVKSGGLIIKGRKIAKILESEEIEDEFDGSILDVGENPVIPGLIDIHIHGAAGWSAYGAGLESVRGLLEYLPTRGVTSFQPTIGGAPLGVIKESLKNIREAKEREYRGAKILGIHMEGPFISPKKKGAFNLEFLINPDLKLMDEFREISGSNIIHVTLAPELEGAQDVIDYLVENNILVSGGHTNAT